MCVMCDNRLCRAGYSPSDYLGSTEWSARLKVELSYAIKCPNIAYHLAGTKKVQQALSVPGELEKFMSPTDCVALRQVFAKQYSLDPKDSSCEDVERTKQEAIAHPELYVMKPQREGGGNNFYNEVRFRFLNNFIYLGAAQCCKRLVVR